MEIVSLATRHRQVLEVSLEQGIIVDPTSRPHVSSRAHAILTIHVEVCEETQLWGRLVLVDLAGSERATCSAGPRLMEARHINASLAALGNVVYALAMKKKHRPWRDAKLTKLLWDSLYRGHVRILATIHADAEFAVDTVSTLSFASRCRRLTVPTSPTYSPVVSESDRENEHYDAQHAVKDITRWFTQVLGALSDECEQGNSHDRVSDPPQECRHLLPMAQRCLEKIRDLKRVHGDISGQRCNQGQFEIFGLSDITHRSGRLER